MPIQDEVREEILSAIMELGKPATIKEIATKVGFERHTLSKYLVVLQREGTLDYYPVGRAKLWQINSAPLKPLFEADPKNLSFAEQVLTKLIQGLPIGVSVLAEDFTIQLMNTIMKETYGDGQGEKFYSFILGDDNPLGLGPLRKVVAGDIEFADTTVNDKEGNTLEIRAQSIRRPDDVPMSVLTIEDITYRDRMEKAIRRSEMFYRSLIETSPYGIYALDLQGTVTFVSLPIIETLGYDTAQEIVGRPVFEFLVEDDHGKARKHMKDLLTKDVGKKRYTLKGKKGKTTRIEVEAAPLRNEEGSPEGYTGYVKNL